MSLILIEEERPCMTGTSLRCCKAPQGLGQIIPILFIRSFVVAADAEDVFGVDLYHPHRRRLIGRFIVVFHDRVRLIHNYRDHLVTIGRYRLLYLEYWFEMIVLQYHWPWRRV